MNTDEHRLKTFFLICVHLCSSVAKCSSYSPPRWRFCWRYSSALIGRRLSRILSASARMPSRSAWPSSRPSPPRRPPRRHGEAHAVPSSLSFLGLGARSLPALPGGRRRPAAQLLGDADRDQLLLVAQQQPLPAGQVALEHAHVAELAARLEDR